MRLIAAMCCLYSSSVVDSAASQRRPFRSVLKRAATFFSRNIATASAFVGKTPDMSMSTSSLDESLDASLDESKCDGDDDMV